MALGEKQRGVKHGHHGFFQRDFLIRFDGVRTPNVDRDLPGFSTTLQWSDRFAGFHNLDGISASQQSPENDQCTENRMGFCSHVMGVSCIF